MGERIWPVEGSVPEVLDLPTFTVYFYYDEDDRLLYVGFTSRGPQRQKQHKTLAVWWPLVARAEFEHYENEEDALEAERTAIAELRPRFNVVGRVAAENPEPAPTGTHLPSGGDADRPVREGPTSSAEVGADGQTPLWDGYVSEKDKSLRSRWGLKLEQWDAIRVEGNPNGGCAACGRHAKKLLLVVDHDHETDELCGALCVSCNRKLTQRLRRYVKDPPARRVAERTGAVGFFLTATRKERLARWRRLREERRLERAKAKAGPPKDDFGDKVQTALEQTTDQGG